MANSSVTVLCPNGRRANVKITPNTSVLQILEDACKKEGFNPDEYNLKHLRRLLDSGLSVRHAGIPNRCLLEVVASTTKRSPSSVTVHIITVAGTRLVHDFPATATLFEILQHHESQVDGGEALLPSPDSGQEAVLVYAMRRISDKELRSTSLRTLGLTHGKCMMRHSMQSVESEGQAHVSSVLSKRPKEHHNQESETKNVSAKKDPKPSTEHDPTPPPLQLSQSSEQPTQLSQVEALDLSMDSMDTVTSSHGVHSAVVHSEADTSRPDTQGVSECSTSMDVGGDGGAPDTSVGSPDTTPPTHNVIKLGLHNAIVFSMDDAPPTHITEEDDTFFQLSVKEVTKLYMEQKKVLRELEDAPLRTSNLRDMEESSRLLSAMNRYPVTHLRVHFPDQFVIQASFKPTDTVATVIAAIRPLLADSSQEFHLYTRHPARTLCEEESLVNAGCVPNARLYFSDTSTGPPYLSTDTLANKSSFAGAINTLTGKKPHRGAGSRLGVGDGADTSHSSPSQQQQQPHPPRQDYTRQPSQASGGAVPKTPKWFKLAK